jgi:class 3 adenylate cyclase/DNA-binding CsgD family transcriptional regulator/pimeloyl-ACP methyl ester carboxylesterase
MEPRIQYARTSDGLNIAFMSLGQGRPYVNVELPVAHFQLEWNDPGSRPAFEFAARFRTVLKYDHRGFGLSDRDVHDFSVEVLIRDLEAVARAADLAPFQLHADGMAVPVAIAYAARHPDLVTHLVLADGGARGVDLVNDQLAAVADLAEKDWMLVSESLQQARFGWSSPAWVRTEAARMREAVNPPTFASFIRHVKFWDVTDLLSAISMPTLVVQNNDPYFGVDRARQMAAAIPRSQLAVFGRFDPEDLKMGWLQPDRRTISRFLTTPDDARPIPTPSGTSIILFADIADSTALTERLGDAAFRAKARELDGALRTVIREHTGTPIEGKLLGDGVLAVFISGREAIEAALASAGSGEDAGLPLHIGLHAGDVIREEGNVYGGAVNVASRISGLAAPGEVLVSDTVRGLARTSAGVAFEDRGDQRLKGISDTVRVWAVMPLDASGVREPPAEVKPSYPDHLTAREVEVLRLIAAGRSSREIGEELVLSERTVERHIANIYAKTGTHGRAQATAYAIAHGLTLSHN